MNSAFRRACARGHRFAQRACALALLAAAAGCSFAPPPSPHAGPDPADANAAVRPVTDTAVIGAYQRFRPVEPRPWREQNERMAPRR